MLLLHHHHTLPRRRLFRSASCCCCVVVCVIGFIQSERCRLFRRICVAMLSRNLELYANSAAAATTSNVSALRGDATDSSNKINVAPPPPPPSGRSLLRVKDKILFATQYDAERPLSFFQFGRSRGKSGKFFSLLVETQQLCGGFL